MELPPELNPFRQLSDNAPCWCMSGQMYGNCHKHRGAARRATPEEALNLLSRQFRSKMGCLHPTAPAGCSGKIINSHTIQKSGPLKTIAHNGEVYSMRGSGDQIIKNNGRMIPQRKGISTVSVFPGFCEKHDNDFFEIVENGEFEINPANLFLLHYRNVCSELHAKTFMQFGEPLLRLMDSGRGKFDQVMAQQLASDMNFGASSAENELSDDREALARMWETQDFSSLSFHFVEFEKQLPFVASFNATPKFSIGGKHIQDWSEDRLRGISVSSINFKGRSGFAFSSVDRDLLLETAADLEDPNIGTPSNLLRWVLSNAENVALQVEWWDHLSDRRQNHLLELAMIGLPFGGPENELEAYNRSVEVLAPAAITRSLTF